MLVQNYDQLISIDTGATRIAKMVKKGRSPPPISTPKNLKGPKGPEIIFVGKSIRPVIVNVEINLNQIHVR